MIKKLPQKSIILLTSFIDALGIGIVIPALPFFTLQHGLPARQLTWLLAIFAFCSFFSAPALGVLSDRFGRKPILFVSLISTSLGWLIFALAINPLWLFLGRIIDGLAAGNFSTAQSYLADLAKDEKERIANLGLAGAIFGLAFIIGPAIGGFLSAIALTLPFWFIGFLAAFNAGLVYFFLPETKSPDPRVKIIFHPFSPIIRSLKNNSLRPLLVAFFLFGTAFAIHQSIFALVLADIFKLNTSGIGITIGVIGTLTAINQGLLMKKFWLKRFNFSRLPKIGLSLLIISFSLMSFLNWPTLIIGVTLLAIGQSLYRTVSNAEIMEKAGAAIRGEISGVLAAVFSLSAIFGPLFSGLIYESHPSIPFIIATLLIFIALILEDTKKIFRRFAK